MYTPFTKDPGMKRILLPIGLLIAGTAAMAQSPEDALRLGTSNSFGTARQLAIGGAMTSLGGEISATYINPAGLGMYRTSEFVLSPGFGLYNGKSDYRGSAAKADKLNKFSLGTSGFVFGMGGNQYSKWKSKAISLTVNRTADFNSTTYYKGQNDFSSFSEQYVLDFAQSGLSLNNDSWRNSNLIGLPTKMAVYEYLIDTLNVSGGGITIIGQGEKAALLDQEKRITTKGGATEFALGYGANMDDKVYWGISVGIPIMNYSRTSYYRESDASGDNDNDFKYASYEETLTQKGVGLNAKLGMIIRPADRWRFGFALHTPTVYGIDENITAAKMVTDLENYPTKYNLPAGPDSVSLNSFPVSTIKYDAFTPWRFMLSGTFILNEVEDVNKQKGFITADVEYTTVQASRFRSADQLGNNDTYYKDLNAATKAIYKNVFNFRAGGELKFKTIMARLGFAYFGNPYEDNSLKGGRMNLSGGLGYRDQGIFIDLTYVHSMGKDVNFPYRLSDKNNTFANLKNNTGNVMLTFGVKF